jgi:hypothetical protein
MRKSKMKITILGCISVFLIATLVLLPAKQAKAETLVENSLFFRISVAFSVDQKAAQEWLPAPWKVVSAPKGPFKGANLYVLFNDYFIRKDGEGKLYRGGTFCYATLVSYGKNPQTKELAIFVTRTYWPHDDPSCFKNAVKSTVSREATIKGVTSEPGAGSEVWKVQDSTGGIMEFRMDYQRGVPTRTKREFKVRSSVEPDLIFNYQDDYASDLIKSISAGIDRVQNYKFRVTIPELRKMFDGSEQLIGILINPSRARQKFRP